MAGVSSRIPSVDGRATPPGDYQSWDEYMADVELVEREAYDRALERRLAKALRLAPNTLVFAALLEGQPVPVSALDPVWSRRYGL
jgi:hypothetical protein